MLCPVAKHTLHRAGISRFGLEERRLTRVVVDESEGTNPEKPLRKARKSRALQELGRLSEPPAIPESARSGGRSARRDAAEDEGPPSLPLSSRRTPGRDVS